MDLTYSPGELEHSNSKKSSDLKREHDSVDDFEHLDPDSSPIDIKPKSVDLTEPGNSNIAKNPLDKHQDLLDLAENHPLGLSENLGNLNTATKIGDHFGDFKLEPEQIKTGLNENTKSNLLDFEESINKPLGLDHFGGTQQTLSATSDFILAEKDGNYIKKTEELGDVTNKSEHSNKETDQPFADHFSSDRDKLNKDFQEKPMKEVDAMAHYNKIYEKVTPKENIDNIDLKESYKSNKHDSLEETNVGSLQPNLNHLESKDISKSDPNKAQTILEKGLNEVEKNDVEVAPGKKEIESGAPEPDLNEREEKKKDSVSSQQNEDNIDPKNKMCVHPKKLYSTNPEEEKPNTKTGLKDEVYENRDLDDIIGPEDVFKRIGLDAWFTPGRLHPIVEALVYWRDPKKSGVVFGSVMAILLSLCYMSLISVVAYSSLLALTGTVCFRIYKNILQAVQKTSEGHPFKEFLELDLSLPQDKVREMTETAVVHVNAAVVELRRLFLVEDLVDSIKFGVCLWCLTYLGAIFNGMTLVILAFVALFTVPKIYENNKANIDQYIEIGRSKVAEITSKVKAAVPIGKKEPEKDKEQ